MKIKPNSTFLPVLGLLIVVFFYNASPNNKVAPKIGLKKGNQAPEIELFIPEGKLVKLSSLRGKIVLIDFWASWCKGCREISKPLESIYNEYKDKHFINGDKFQIFSVCLDTDRQRWLEAIEKDSLHHCINVSDLKGFKSQLAKDYKLGGLPNGYVIDGDGIILGDLGELKSILTEYCISD